MAQQLEPPSAADAADPGQQQVGVVYAKAFLGAALGGAKDAALGAKLLEELDSLVDDVLDRYPEFHRVLASAQVSADEKTATLDRVFGKQASPLMLNFLKVLARHGRLDSLRAIRTAAHEQYNRLIGRQRVEVVTATPLDNAGLTRVKQKLRNMLGGEPELVQTINPDLLGGIILRVADTVLDGSVARRLSRVRQQMIDRSVNEIQRRRDSFSNSAGN